LIRIDLFDEDQEIIKPKKERKKVVHENLLKKKRKKGEKSKRDYVDGARLYRLMCAWWFLKKRILKIRKQIENPFLSEEMFEKIGNKFFQLKLAHKSAFDELTTSYLLIAKKYTNHKNFIGIPKDTKHELAMTALIKGMSIGKNKNNKNYGIPYMCRFDINKSESVFSFFDQTIQNFFYQYTNDQKRYREIKQECLHSRFRQLQQDAFNLGIKGPLNFYADCVSDED